MPLDEQRRTQLDGIVSKMASNGEPDEAIQFVVNDFKTKYDIPTPSPDGIVDAPRPGAPGMMDVAKGFAKGAMNTVYQGGDFIRRNLGMERPLEKPELQEALKPQNEAEKFGSMAEEAVELVGAGEPLLKAGMKAPGVLAKVAGISKPRAVSNLATAAEAAKNVVLNVEKPGQVALQLTEARQFGKYVPRVVDNFVREITDPNAAPMTFEKARKYYSSISELSADEYGKLAPMVKRGIIQLKQALQAELTNAASSVGKGEEYVKGIKEYARASKVAEKAPKVAKIAAGSAAGAVGAGAGYGIVQRLLGR